ncbi:hypothetical protein ACB098_01G158300 [Castanea mollissima]
MAETLKPCHWSPPKSPQPHLHGDTVSHHEPQRNGSHPRVSPSQNPLSLISRGQPRAEPDEHHHHSRQHSSKAPPQLVAAFLSPFLSLALSYLFLFYFLISLFRILCGFRV